MLGKPKNLLTQQLLNLRNAIGNNRLLILCTQNIYALVIGENSLCGVILMQQLLNLIKMEKKYAKPEKLSMLSIFVALAKFGVVLFSWVITILFVLVVLLVTDRGSE